MSKLVIAALHLAFTPLFDWAANMASNGGDPLLAIAFWLGAVTSLFRYFINVVEWVDERINDGYHKR